MIEVFVVETRAQGGDTQSHSPHCSVRTVRLQGEGDELNRPAAERRPERRQILAGAAIDAVWYPTPARRLELGDHPQLGLGSNLRKAVQESRYVVPEAGCEGNLDLLAQMIACAAKRPACESCHH